MVYRALTGTPNSGVPGTIYLLHFDAPYAHARHYLGWAAHVEARLAHHAAGSGARLTAAAAAAGIGWTVARTWQGDRNAERRLHNRGGGARLCPICRAAARPGRPRATAPRDA